MSNGRHWIHSLRLKKKIGKGEIGAAETEKRGRDRKKFKGVGYFPGLCQMMESFHDGILFPFSLVLLKHSFFTITYKNSGENRKK